MTHADRAVALRCAKPYLQLVIAVVELETVTAMAVPALRADAPYGAHIALGRFTRACSMPARGVATGQVVLGTAASIAGQPQRFSA
ncbi:hypothetical protein G6F58_013426 [Rhizopus delemar]|nr:hypothetical protein G6F58_013426 [Rhizopus delemar]